MYRKRHQKRGGWPEFLDNALVQAKEKASGLIDSASSTMNTMQKSATDAMDVGQSTQSGEPNRSMEAIMVSNEQTIPPVQEGGKSRCKKRKRTKRTKRRSSVRQRR